MDLTFGLGIPLLIGVLSTIAAVLSLFVPSLQGPGRVLTAATKKIIPFGNPAIWSFIAFLSLGIFLGGTSAVMGYLSAATVAGDNTADNVNIDISSCPDTQRTVMFKAQDALSAAALTGYTHQYRIVTKDGIESAAVNVNDGSTDTLYVGSKLKVLFAGANTTTGQYFAKEVEYLVPCEGSPNAFAQIYRNGTATIQVYNEEGNLIDVSNNETLATGDVASLDINIKGQSDRAQPNGFVAVIEYNSSDYDKVDLSIGGVKEKVAIPTFFTVSSTANTAVAYKVPAMIDNNKLSGQLTLDVKSTANPGVATGNGPVIRLYALQYYTDEDAGGAFKGPAVEDQDGAATYAGPIATFTAYTL
jgi:hypothetical protein